MSLLEAFVPEKEGKQASVAVIGAGPAGLFAARELSKAGVQVALINRDIKPGGLAEYGIYPNKHKMKEGLRRQFRKVLEEPNTHYFGNMSIGLDDDLTLEELQELGFDALLVCVGAQGTKWLGLPGEELDGVYHAKDIVYHYNNLPPFSEKSFSIGEKILCVGVGNVMLDIAHWAIRDLKVEEVVAIARRGPADVKFTKKEMEIVAKNLDLAALDAEFERTGPMMEAVGQDADQAKQFILSSLERAKDPVSDTKFSLDFLVSPKRLIGDEDGRVRGVEAEDTLLEAREGGGTKAVGQGSTRLIEADTVVFCIGDKVDVSMGLPLDKWGEFAKAPTPRFPINGISFEAYDPLSESILDGIFLAGWSREASSGLVGTARRDGNQGAKAALASLEEKGAGSTNAIEKLEERISALAKPIVRKADWVKLEEVEGALANEQGIEHFKFSSNEDMLTAMGLLAEKV